MLKTKKGVAKRFKLNKKGKVTYHPGGKGHLLTNKQSERLRRLRKKDGLKGSKENSFIKRMLPYG